MSETDSSTEPRPARPHLSTRTKARKRALDILFESELRARDVLETLRERRLEADPPLRQYSAELVEGVVDNREAIDSALRQALDDGWTLERMPRVDRNLARLAVWEIQYAQIPARVAIAEALILAGELSTDESPAFLNGLLSGVARQPLLNEDDVAEIHAEQATADVN